ncbi:MAG: AfsR/SARP family transcriptional regulator [Acidimicrobiales bacterium]
MGDGDWRVNLLGGFTLTERGRAVSLTMASSRLLAYLAVQGRPVRSSAFASALWPRVDGHRAVANLRAAVWRLPDRCHRLVVRSGPEVSLAPGTTSDVADLERHVERILAGTAGAADLDVRPLLGDLLPTWYDDWVLVERERHVQRRVRALERLAALLGTAGRYGEAIEAAMAAVAAEPLRDTARRRLIALHRAEGNAGEARRQSELYAALLRDQLGIEPPPGWWDHLDRDSDVTHL